jgi:ATP phosphoribosyltransferase
VHDIVLLEQGWGPCKAALGFGQCSLVLAGAHGMTVATSYPNIARAFLGPDIRIVTMSGSVELAPRLGIADAIVEIVGTGSTLCRHGLPIIEYIYRDLNTYLIGDGVAV